MEHIVTELDRYANQFLGEYVKSLPRISNALKWYDTNVNEVKPFIALLALFQGMVFERKNFTFFIFHACDL